MTRWPCGQQTSRPTPQPGTHSEPMTTERAMDCDLWREAISASVDGEACGIDPRLIDSHLARCPACRLFRNTAEQSRRISLVQPTHPMPDLARKVTKFAAAADRAARWSFARAALAVVAIEIIVLSLPALIIGDEQSSSTHLARHLGAFTVAYGAALLVVVVRPARARAVLPVALVLAGALVITAIIDLVDRRIPLIGEATHLPELLSVVLIWLMTVPSPRRLPKLRRRSGFESVDLHLVGEQRDAG